MTAKGIRATIGTMQDERKAVAAARPVANRYFVGREGSPVKSSEREASSTTHSSSTAEPKPPRDYQKFSGRTL